MTRPSGPLFLGVTAVILLGVTCVWADQDPPQLGTSVRPTCDWCSADPAFIQPDARDLAGLAAARSVRRLRSDILALDRRIDDYLLWERSQKVGAVEDGRKAEAAENADLRTQEETTPRDTAAAKRSQ